MESQLGIETQNNATAESDAPGNLGSPFSTSSAKKTNDGTSDRGFRVLDILLVISLVLLSLQWLWITTRQPESLPWREGDEYHRLFRVDVNESGWIEWMQLNGIGETMAHRIVADREINGPFRSVDELLRINGIGPVTLEQIRPWIKIGHEFSTEISPTVGEQSE